MSYAKSYFCEIKFNILKISSFCNSDSVIAYIQNHQIYKNQNLLLHLLIYCKFKCYSHHYIIYSSLLYCNILCDIELSKKIH